MRDSYSLLTALELSARTALPRRLRVQLARRQPLACRRRHRGSMQQQCEPAAARRLKSVAASAKSALRIESAVLVDRLSPGTPWPAGSSCTCDLALPLPVLSHRISRRHALELPYCCRCLLANDKLSLAPAAL